MRKVTYFMAGTVADFAIPDHRFDAFARQVSRAIGHQESELDKARRVLEALVRRAAGEAAGAEEVLAACFVWNFFNTNPDDARHIAGDVMIIDLEGDGETIDYAAVADVGLAPGN